MTKQQSYFWFGLFAFGNIAFTAVQDYIRPHYHGQSDVIKYLLGIAPNFFAGLGLSSFFVVMITYMNAAAPKPSASVWMNSKVQISSMLMAVTGLSLWEFVQIFSSRGHFDWHDLLWTFIGAFTFYVIWLRINGSK
jgi:hypothetical protein